ncbi:cupin domain-containing protein [Aeromicrobium fastidiosum]|uniref:Cupin domain-containing protein n=2 Tax=Aeromicrobium fastidiosum TaxID=52699 RepID=A0A641ATV0_9ACTN|nr:cupin domain-containing protein [Aeromicrobium fastidiosum]
MPGRAIIEPSPHGWVGVAMTEWELRAAEWTDQHPFDEYNFVLAGELHVESDGQVAVAAVGDTIRVRAGSTGRYWAPVYARMLSIYAPNPEGLDSQSMGLRRLDG